MPREEISLPTPSDLGAAASPPIRRAQRSGDALARKPQFEWLARAGLVARGVVYALIGGLAFALALGEGGKATNQQGALRTIAGQPFGEVLLIAIAVGLAGYALWRIVRAALGHGPEQSDSGMERIAGLASGIAYAALCVTAVKIVVGAGGGERSGHPDQAAAGVLGWTGGRWLVGIAGLVLLGVAADQAYKGIKRTFLEQSKTEQMTAEVKRAFTALGVFGHLARTVVFALMGYFLIRAAIDFRASEAVGLDGAIAKIAHLSYGPVLLGIVAAGLIGFGLYSLADARYRRV
jgi:hypothetical protein